MTDGEPDVTFGLGELRDHLGWRSYLRDSTDWRRRGYLRPHNGGAHPGRGTHVRYTARDAVVVHTILALRCCPDHAYGSQNLFGAPLIAWVANAIQDAPWGCAALHYDDGLVDLLVTPDWSAGWRIARRIALAVG